MFAFVIASDWTTAVSLYFKLDHYGHQASQLKYRVRLFSNMFPSKGCLELSELVWHLHMVMLKRYAG